MTRDMLKRLASRVFGLVAATWLAATGALIAAEADFGQWSGLMAWLLPAYMGLLGYRDWLQSRKPA
jgi:hypothetical protein